MFVEITLPGLLRTGQLRATVGLESSLKQNDFIILCLPTPLDERKRPYLRIMRDTLTRLSRIIARGKLIVIESSVYPGFTEEQARGISEKIEDLPNTLRVAQKHHSSRRQHDKERPGSRHGKDNKAVSSIMATMNMPWNKYRRPIADSCYGPRGADNRSKASRKQD